MTQVRGARALVTGATGGLGHSIAWALHAGGAELLLTGRDREKLYRLAAAVDARAVVADLSVREDLDGLIEEAREIDIAVLNAGVPATGDVADWEPEQIERALAVNLRAPIALTRALVPQLRRRGSGHLVYVSSLSGKVASRGGAVYSATKFGLRGFAQGVRCDLLGSGVGCSVVNPGFVRDAGMFADTGVVAPRGVPTVTPEAVATAVLGAIRTNRAEMDVAPLHLKLGAAIGSLVPGTSARVQARLGSDLPEEIAAAQRHKRV